VPGPEAGRDQHPRDAYRSAIGEWDASADALPDAARGAQPARQDVRAGKSAGPEPDVPGPDVQPLLREPLVGPISGALCIPGAAPFGARLFWVEALPAGPVRSLSLILPPELEAERKRKLPEMRRVLKLPPEVGALGKLPLVAVLESPEAPARPPEAG
jgi:hypothetical protein